MSLKKVFLNTSEYFRGKTAAFYFSLFFLFSRDLFAIFCMT